MSGRQTIKHVTIMAMLGSIASHSSAGTSDQVGSFSSTCRIVTRRPTPAPMSRMPSPNIRVSAILLESGNCSFHDAGIGNDHMASSIARPHAATAATTGTWGRQYPGSVGDQYLEKGIQRTEMMMMLKTIQRMLSTPHANTKYWRSQLLCRSSGDNVGMVQYHAVIDGMR